MNAHLAKWIMYHEVHGMHHEGYSISKINDLLGLHRDTIRKYLAMSEEDYEALHIKQSERRKELELTKNLLENDLGFILKHPYKDTWNLIDVKIKRAEQVIKSLMPFFSFPAFKERYIQDKSFKITHNTTSINYICAEVCKDYLENRQFPMTVKINDSVRSILKFTKTENLPMQSITPKFCREYEEYMYNKSKKKSRNGAGINLRHIRILFNKAIDKGLVPKEWYPFKRNNGDKSGFENAYVIPNERKVKDYLNEDELIAFSEAKIFATAAQRRAHWGWLASFYCNGSNAADFLLFKFKDIKNDFIIFYREKTKNSTRTDRKPIKIYLSEELKSLIAEVGNPAAPNNYIFKCFDDSMNEEEMYEARIKFTANVSKSVKFLASHLGIHKSMKLSNARHSLANLFKKNNVDRETAKDIFGHSSIITLDHRIPSGDIGNQSRIQYFQSH